LLISVSAFAKDETQYSTIKIDQIVSEDFNLFEEEIPAVQIEKKAVKPEQAYGGEKAETEQVLSSELKQKQINHPWVRILLGILFLVVLYRLVLFLPRR